MFQLHSVDWLHKSFHPNNILLFGNPVSGAVQFDWSAPYVVGFDSFAFGFEALEIKKNRRSPDWPITEMTAAEDIFGTI
jgi:hypothetical protein